MTQQRMTAEQVKALLARPRKRDQGHGDKAKPIYIPTNAHITRQGDTIRLVIPPPVSANSYWRNRVVHAPGRKPMSITYLSAQAKAYKAVVKRMGQYCEPFRGPVRVTARVFFPRRGADLGNAEKITSDSLQGIAFLDDKQIEEHHWYRGIDRDNPRIELEIVSLGKVTGLLFGEMEAPKAKRKGKA